MNALKALAAIAVSAAAALVTALAGFGSDSTISDLDAKTWLISVGAILGSGGLVWFVENVHGVAGGIIKAVVGFLTAGIATLVVALDDSVVTQGEWLVAFIAAATATGFVYQLTNRETPPTG